MSHDIGTLVCEDGWDHKCTTFTKPIQCLKKGFVSAFYVSTQSTNEKSLHRAAAGRKWKNKFRNSVRAVVFNPTCASIMEIMVLNVGYIEAVREELEW